MLNLKEFYGFGGLDELTEDESVDRLESHGDSDVDIAIDVIQSDDDAQHSDEHHAAGNVSSDTNDFDREV